jgi:hypothetical protein
MKNLTIFNFQFSIFNSLQISPTKSSLLGIEKIRAISYSVFKQQRQEFLEDEIRDVQLL